MKLQVNTKNIKSIIRAGALGLLLIGLKAETVKAQLHPLGSVYYQNPYLINPALAGREEGWFANAAFRQQWSSMPGAPSTQALSFEYGSGKKSGVGVNLYNDEAGLQKRTRVRGTYAYQLPLDADGQKLSFGVSIGYSDDHLMQERLSSNVDGSDRSIAGYQDRDTYFDGDFGAAYQGKKLGLELAVPNLKSFFKKDQAEGNIADESKFYTSASYKLLSNDALDGMTLEPKVAYRQIRGYKDIVDFGANLTLAENKVNVMAMYHSTRSTTIGMGVKYQKYLIISGIFTSGTAQIRDYANGNFEVNLRVNLDEVFKGKK
ncbi:PorP/SprF family type IX secretion system membrane protein [Desertivirga brevis]|uniref:PorP/SprF family type IX secretion system membrane protein n=2 Tax=Desertivirga brevis TaxID=2810310 RepID=UPI001A9661CE|nr:type IX secretion system membrane protein PorP/SprF [Pedobacter sp. SYSU D00873]